MRGRRILVTGASGFVGANLARRLVSDGARVAAGLRSEPGWRLADVTADLDLVHLDLLDERSVAAAVRRIRPTVIFHLAASGAYSWETELDRIVRTNYLGTITLLKECLREGFDAFVLAGSSSEYGFKDHAPAESEALEPNSDYAATKAATTLFASHVGRRTGTRVVSLRLYSAYGPWEDPKRLIPTLLAHGLRGKLPPLVDPDVARDFVHVDDVCEAFVIASERATPGAIYNLGSGRQTTIRGVVQIVREYLQIEREPDWGSMSNRSWDTDVWVADTSKIRRELGWNARISLPQGIRQTVDWVRERRDLWPRYGIDALVPWGAQQCS